MNNAFIIFYKDKDGYDVPYSEYGVYSAYTTELMAEIGLADIKDKVRDILKPRIVYKKVRKGLFKHEMVQVKPEPLPEHIKQDLVQILNTGFIRKSVI